MLDINQFYTNWKQNKNNEFFFFEIKFTVAFPIPLLQLSHQLGVLLFKLILTLTGVWSIRLQMLQESIPQDSFPSDASLK